MQKRVGSKEDTMHAQFAGWTLRHRMRRKVIGPHYLKDGVHDNSQRPVTRQLCYSKNMKTPFVHLF